ncbi:hypothetical protein An07g08000 [Aspergillus niger]|uniref:Uncharacterized protein n=2 Tax=Aspergillus niger TaxID=5061 RepID=A2QP29_ASPNC|nr:hypothetical protein An07g08000 [Aspergillus niger]CAK39616.1 hypothetical protein An07g08000 [Aspergillus niger]
MAHGSPNVLRPSEEAEGISPRTAIRRARPRSLPSAGLLRLVWKLSRLFPLNAVLKPSSVAVSSCWREDAMVQPIHEARQPGQKHKHKLGLRFPSSPPAYGAMVPPAYLPAESKMAGLGPHLAGLAGHPFVERELPVVGPVGKLGSHLHDYHYYYYHSASEKTPFVACGPIRDARLVTMIPAGTGLATSGSGLCRAIPVWERLAFNHRYDTVHQSLVLKLGRKWLRIRQKPRGRILTYQIRFQLRQRSALVAMASYIVRSLCSVPTLSASSDGIITPNSDHAPQPAPWRASLALGSTNARCGDECQPAVLLLGQSGTSRGTLDFYRPVNVAGHRREVDIAPIVKSIFAGVSLQSASAKGHGVRRQRQDTLPGPAKVWGAIRARYMYHGICI